MSNIKISIIIITYNHEKYIEQTIDCILSQQVDFQYEIIVYDDFSNDRTVDIIKEKYGKKVIMHEREKNVGLCINFYDALRSAKGDYVFDLAGDDYLYDNNVLQTCLSFLEDHLEYGSVSGWSQICNGNNEEIDRIQNFKSKYYLQDFLLGERPFCGHGLIRNLWKTNLALDLTHIYKASRNNEEIPTWIFFLEQGPKAILQQYIYIYRYVNEKNASNYNSNITRGGIFCDNYRSIKYMQRVNRIYNFKGLILKYGYRYIAGAIEQRDIKALWKITTNLTIRDLIMCVCNLPIMYFRKQEVPMKLQKKIIDSIIN